jgi:hypothetical protein
MTLAIATPSTQKDSILAGEFSMHTMKIQRYREYRDTDDPNMAFIGSLVLRPHSLFPRFPNL